MIGGCIHVLPTDLADQIAAGEVVERPASVVKELVENSIDAGATRIDIEVEGGGRRMIRVVDNGSGMNERDAKLSLTRHATSKLRVFDDLGNLGTMGFRGEALPSIAAVSRFTLTTRPADAVAALHIEVAGGQVTDEHEAGAPVGTCIEVRDLMWNVPARLKFLKAEPTEAGHVSETVSRLAMAHPDVAFRLRSAGRLALDLPVHASMLERVQAIVGRRLSAQLFASEHEEEGVYVRCFLAPPELAQSTSRGLKFYAGKRYIRDRGLLHAVFMGYAHLIPKGRYANAIIMIDAPDGAVDINVHPQKLEVRFAQAQTVYAAVRHAVGAAVAKTPWLAQPAGAAGTPGFGTGWKSVTPLRPKNGEKNGAARASELALSYADRQERLLFSARKRPVNDVGEPAAVVAAGSGPNILGQASGPVLGGLAQAADQPVADGFFSRLGYIGQLDRTYLVCQIEGELVLVDQHAAHERVVFERLRAVREQHQPPAQKLLIPITLDLSPGQIAAAEENAEPLAAAGFDLSPFGGRTYTVGSAPADLKIADITNTITELLDELADSGVASALQDRIDMVLATVACHSVVRAGDSMSVETVRALFTSLDQVDRKMHCPHGRPVLLRIGTNEIAHRFGRST